MIGNAMIIDRSLTMIDNREIDVRSENKHPITWLQVTGHGTCKVT
jgi:hypothetical protein